MSKKTDSDGRQAGEFTDEEGRIHQAGFKVIFEGMKKGLGFDEASSGLQVVNPEMRRVIIDDYLKITVAERHFQGEESLEAVAAGLKIPVERVAAVKEVMIREVQEAAKAVYRAQADDAGFDVAPAPEGDGETKES